MPGHILPTLPEDSFNRLVQTRHGPMLANRHDQYVGASLLKYGEFSAGESAIFRQLVPAGGIVIEAGANIGAHTVELSRLVGPTGAVIVFEPQRIVFQTLCANLALNACANVHAFQAAVGATPGEILVPFLPPGQPNNFGGLSLLGTSEGERVPLRTLDSLGLHACHMMKLDVEGMEADALRGAADLVQAHRPHLYVENDRKERADELIRLIMGWNYKLYWHLPPLFNADNFAGDAENIFGNIVSFNMLCIAAERDITVQGLQEIVPVTPA